MGMFDSFFGGGSPKIPDQSKDFYDYSDFMGGKADRYNPWVDAGNRARDMNEGQYSRLINNPNAVQDQVASGFQYSPYQKFMLGNTTNMMNYNAANTGMLGTTQANQSLMSDLLNMTGQYEDTYINRGMDSYNRGLQGNEFLQQQGMQGMGAQDNLYEQQGAARLKGDIAKQQSAYQNAVQDQQDSNNMWGNIIGLAGGVAGGMMGGPMGAQIGSSLGHSMFGGGSGGGGGGGGGGSQMDQFGSMIGSGARNWFNGNSRGGYSPVPSNMPAGGWGSLT